jgi:hypothetical protein
VDVDDADCSALDVTGIFRIVDGGKAELVGLLLDLTDEIGIGRDIERRADPLVGAGLEDQESYDGLPAASIDLDDEVPLLAPLLPFIEDRTLARRYSRWEARSGRALKISCGEVRVSKAARSGRDPKSKGMIQVSVNGRHPTTGRSGRVIHRTNSENVLPYNLLQGARTGDYEGKGSPIGHEGRPSDPD